jgi:hypothetical protein
MALALLTACLWPVCWPLAILVVLIAGMTRETSPIWAAIWAWHPVLLIGLVPVLIRQLTYTPGPDPEFQWYLDHPLKAGIQAHRGIWNAARWMLTPWAGLVLGVAVLDPWTMNSARLLVALAFGYGQLLLAVDTPQWLPLIALSIIYNPWK